MRFEVYKEASYRWRVRLVDKDDILWAVMPHHFNGKVLALRRAAELSNLITAEASAWIEIGENIEVRLVSTEAD